MKENNGGKGIARGGPGARLHPHSKCCLALLKTNNEQDSDF